MKNSILIDIDTEREPVVLIGKPQEIKQPETPEEAKKMVLLDITSCCEALCTLIHMADQSGYGDKTELVSTSIKHLNDMLVIPPEKSQDEGNINN